MAYTKTVWVNDSVPAINQTNLNKIEQGIYNADERSINNETNIGYLAQLNTTNKSNLVGAINSIVESGSNANGTYIKYADGTMICIKKITFTNVVINTAWGNFYETASMLDFGDYAKEFIGIPNVCITLADGATCFCETFSGRTKTSIGSTWLWKPVVEESGTMTFDVIAIGKWK